MICLKVLMVSRLGRESNDHISKLSPLDIVGDLLLDM